MEHNKIKIVSNIKLRRIAYYFKNESSEWMRVPNSSGLSRKEFCETTISEKIYDIIKIIDDVYNPGNRGVEVLFEGTDEEYTIIRNTVKKANMCDSIICNQKKAKIAVVGKIGSGKTTLIESIGEHLTTNFSKKKNAQYDVFIDEKGNTEWYELKGIDLGKEYITQSNAVLTELAESGMTVLVYCLSTYKVEELEEKLILEFSGQHPEINILITLTSCVDEDAASYAEQISSRLNKKVIPVLAKEKKTRNGSIPAYGLEQAVQYIYEGK